MDCFHKAEKLKRAKPTEMFEDVYDVLPLHLQRQKKELVDHLKLYKNEYPLELFEKI
jgi:2-oxoisovalerate dehydrogenase E1 component alpha subunit